jgi:N-glycosylase/DNA lyase
MKRKKLAPLDREELLALHAQQKKAIRARLADFERIPASEYFYECVYCLLTPQSSAVNAGKAVAALQTADFRNNEIDPEPLLHTKEYYIRFHRTKAKHLIAFKEQFADVEPFLVPARGDGSSIAAREWLVKNVKGVGWKEASHLLRNIGHRDLAILDRHILKNLVRAGAMSSLPKTLTPKRYAAIEGKFLKFADDISIPMDELDLLFWSMETGQILK